MPIIKSALKRARQQLKRRSHNLVVKSQVKKDIKAFMTAVEAKDAAAIQATLKEAYSEIDRAAKKGTIHKNTADRRKSRLAALANKATAEEKPAKAAKPKKATAAKKPAAKKPAAKKPATVKKPAK